MFVGLDEETVCVVTTVDSDRRKDTVTHVVCPRPIRISDAKRTLHLIQGKETTRMGLYTLKHEDVTINVLHVELNRVVWISVLVQDIVEVFSHRCLVSVVERQDVLDDSCRRDHHSSHLSHAYCSELLRE